MNVKLGPHGEPPESFEDGEQFYNSFLCCGLVNEDPENDGWFFKMQLSDPTELDDLLDEADYQAFIQEEL